MSMIEQHANPMNQLIKEEEFWTVVSFLQNERLDSEYPQALYSDKLYYCLAGILVNQILVDVYGKEAMKDKIGEYLSVGTVAELKQKLGKLFNEMTTRIKLSNLLPFLKSFIVIFTATPTCFSQDGILRICYFAGFQTENLLWK
ncbi:hypothetical protein [Aneurinibacillus tyrosinisolvens]|uniref:hypothetical protein n=1 Tax=Aneurinibacillus tyrosinisolvens TaxID=1443435 RepID=UPI00063F0CA0|nr:hypothetical protein [Aneurinibacillus tyrosinisolvens]